LKIILATTTSPFVYGGAVLLTTWLENALTSRGHEVETYGIPTFDDPESLAAQMVGLRMWNFTGYGDRLIALRTPSYLVKHHSKVVWFLHHLRGAYDLWDTYPSVPDDPSGREFRRMMFSSDDMALAECEHIFTNSKRVSERVKRFNGLASEVLYPPLGEDIEYHGGPMGDTMVYVSRVVAHKRQLLVVQALAHTRNPVKLVLAGRDDQNSDYAAEIYKEIDRLGLAERVNFVNTVISEQTKTRLMAGSLGVVYLPLDEDSYGFVGLEAAAARKPVVTTTDSGGVLELVEDGVNGLVTEPQPPELARAFDYLYENRASAERMGLAQADRLAALNISWDHVIDRLLA
jgi:glycosyltransferase involved in cell wall biosynthesis